MASAAREYFDQLRSEGYEAIARLPSLPEPTFENDWRDFKGWYPGKDDELKRVWSKAVSAFANTQGGVVVWGVVAETKPGSKIDRVIGLAEVQQPEDWIQRLKNWKLHATDPPVGNIEYAAIPHPTEPRGIVACLIPESEFKPHRGEFADRNYYIRAGDSSVIPSPSLLRPLFFPKPRMAVALEIESRVDPGFKRSKVLMRLINRGYSSVRNGVIHVEIQPDGDGAPARDAVFGRSQAELSGAPTNKVVSYSLQSELHPGMPILFGHVRTNLRSIKLAVVLYQSDCPPLHIWVEPDFVVVKDGEVRLVPLDDSEHADRIARMDST